MAVELSVVEEISAAAADMPRIETDPDTACPTLLTAAVSLVAEVVVAWLDVAIAEVLVAAKSSAAGSACIGPAASGSNPWYKTADKPFP